MAATWSHLVFCYHLWPGWPAPWLIILILGLLHLLPMTPLYSDRTQQNSALQRRTCYAVTVAYFITLCNGYSCKQFRLESVRPSKHLKIWASLTELAWMDRTGVQSRRGCSMSFSVLTTLIVTLLLQHQQLLGSISSIIFSYFVAVASRAASGALFRS